MANLLVADACVLINLVASETLAEIAEANGIELGVARPAANETLYIHRPAEQGVEKLPIDMPALQRRGQIHFLDFEAVELAAFVEMAATIGDGEAATLSIAVHRGLAVATDDRRALRYIQERGLRLVAHGTAGLVRQWAHVTKASMARAHEVLNRIETCARFEPSRFDPNYEWWLQVLRGRR